MTDDTPSPSPIQFGEVIETSRLSPSMVRVALSGGTLADFTATSHTDQYINGQFLADDALLDVPFTPEAVVEADPKSRPRSRRYTVRAWDGAQSRLTIDFVVHGDVGYAGRWAQRAIPGDRLQFTGPSGGYRPQGDADWHLFAGDESALPAVAASLEAIDGSARCLAVIVVDGPADELSLADLTNLDVHWLHRNDAADPAMLLPNALVDLEFPAGQPDIFVHGEAGEVRAVRRHLAIDRRLNIESASISPYWRRDHTDEAWRKVKRQWMAEANADL